MKNGGYSAFSSFDVLISEQGVLFLPLLILLFWWKGGVLNLRSALSLIFSMGIGGGRPIDVPRTQLCMFWNHINVGASLRR